jgi:DNA-binding NarL/FixJ family response regulator
MGTTSISGSQKKVYLVEDHPVFREGLVQILNTEDGLVVCGEAGTAEEALAAIPDLKPDIVLVDLTLPGKSGLELIKEIRGFDRGIKLLVVSMHDEALYADRVLRAGGDGYIMKQEDPEEIVNAIWDVLQGRIYVSEQVMESRSKALKKHPAQPTPHSTEQLSDAELEVLRLLGRGKSNAEIAAQLKLDVQTVASRCEAISLKLDLPSANQMIRFAVCWVEAGGL